MGIWACAWRILECASSLGLVQDSNVDKGYSCMRNRSCGVTAQGNQACVKSVRAVSCVQQHPRRGFLLHRRSGAPA